MFPDSCQLTDFVAEDILVTHGPPCGILDNVGRGIHAGCPELLKRVTRISGDTAGWAGWLLRPRILEFI